jgi:hypothetical protein
MSKRRRDRQPNLPPEAFNAPAAMPQPQPDKPEAAKTDYVQVTPAKRGAATAAAPADTVDWKGEYGQVLGDLRRTFIIFSALVLAMVALSFVIR